MTVITLNSLTSLITSTPPSNQITHLENLLIQRSIALLDLQDSTRELYEVREEFEDLIGVFRARVGSGRGVKGEDKDLLRNSTASMKLTGEIGGGGKKFTSTTQEIENEFLKKYKSVLEGFEVDWGKNSKLFKHWDLISSISSFSPLSSSHSTSTSNSSIPTSWLTTLEEDSSQTVLEILTLLQSNPYTLGAGIVLEDNLLSKLLSSKNKEDSTMKILFKFITCSNPNGSEKVLELVIGIWESGIRELVGWEMSDTEEEVEDLSMKGKGKETGRKEGRGTRVKELEDFLIGILNLLDSLGLEVHSNLLATSPSTSTNTSNPTSSTSKNGTGPFTLSRNIEDILLSLLHESQSLPLAPPPPPPTIPSPLNFKSSLPTETWKLNNLTNSITASLNTNFDSLRTSTTSLNSFTNDVTNSISSNSKSLLGGVTNLGIEFIDFAGKGVVGTVQGSVGNVTSGLGRLFSVGSVSVREEGFEEGKKKEGGRIPSAFRKQGMGQERKEEETKMKKVPSSPSKILQSSNFNSSDSSTTGPDSTRKENEKETPLDSLLVKTSIELLQAFTPPSSLSSTSSSTSTHKKEPFLQILLYHLLSISFPSPSPFTSTNTTSSNSSTSTSTSNSKTRKEPHHQKILLLFILRFYGFNYLNRKLNFLPTGKSYTTPHFPCGLSLSSSTTMDSSSSSSRDNLHGGGDSLLLLLEEIGKRGTNTLMDEVYISEEMNLRLFSGGVHRILYGALVEVCGFSREVEKEGEEEEEEEENVHEKLEEGREELKKVAREFITTLGNFKERYNDITSSSSTTKSIKAFKISSYDFKTLCENFSHLVLLQDLPISISGPSLFSRRSFKRGNSYTTSGSTSSSSTEKERRSEVREEGIGGNNLRDRLGRVLDELKGFRMKGLSVGGDALLFGVSSGEKGKIQVLDRIPEVEFESLTSSTTTSNPPSKDQFSDIRERKKEKDDTGWISPPRSPRFEALQSGIQNSQSLSDSRREDYFDTKEVSLTHISSSSITPPRVVKSGNISWSGRNKKEEEREKVEEKEVEEPSTSEIVLLRKAIIGLIRGGYSSSSTSTTNFDPLEELIQILSIASSEANSQRDFPNHVLYSQAGLTLKFYSTRIPSILDRVAVPFLESYKVETSKLQVVQKRLGELELQYKQLLDSARSERGNLDDLRIKMWYESLRNSSEIYQQLISRLKELSTPRSLKEKEMAKKNFEDWSNELGIFSFVKSRSDSNELEANFEHSLQWVEIFIAMIMNPDHFFNSPYWIRESEVVNSLVKNRLVSSGGIKNRLPSFAETLISTSTNILTAPLSLAGITSSSSTDTSSISPPPPNIVLSFGAASPSLLRSHEIHINFAGAVEENLNRVGLKLAGLIWSDVYYSRIVLNRDSNHQLIGSDGWIESLSSPLSPLPRSTELNASEYKYAKGINLPKVFLPTTSPPPEYCRDLMRRFEIHPSPQAKILALFELEVTITAILSAPTSASINSSTSKILDPIITSTSTSTPRSMIAKLSTLLAKRMSLAPSPITVLLEGGDEDENEDEEEVLEDERLLHRRNTSILSAGTTTTQSPIRRRRLSSVTSDSTSEYRHPLLLIDDPPPVTSTRNGSSPSTDELLNTFEAMLKHTRPNTLFQNLQIIASIIPSTVDSGPVGKSFWDIALASLGFKKEIVEGEFGVVERGISAISEGTEEGRELASRLLRIGANEDSSTAIELLKSFVNSE